LPAGYLTLRRRLPCNARNAGLTSQKPNAQRTHESAGSLGFDGRRFAVEASQEHRNAVDKGRVPSLDQNLAVWGATYDWSQRGDEWSDAWGGVAYQWWTTLFVRLQGYVPAARILEIAPGYGRWTHFLRDLCEELIIVDIAEAAIAHCRQRFASDLHISAYVNDGTTLAMAADNSIDLVFSFDSLVHAEAPIMAGYLAELARILAPDGVAFLHHSNLGAYPAGSYDPDNVHWRAPSVSAGSIERAASAAGLSCVSQETVAWGNDTLLNHCFSVITRGGSRWDRENVIVENLEFSRQEIATAHRLSTQYPPSRREIRFGIRSGPATEVQHMQARALDLLNRGETARAGHPPQPRPTLARSRHTQRPGCSDHALRR
jgi:SAM-dependent methyltransferase